MSPKKLLLFAILFLFVGAAIALTVVQHGERLPALEDVREKAQRAAKEAWGRATFVSSEQYENPVDGTPALYVFTFYKGSGTIPDEPQITQKVARAREERLEAEKKERIYTSSGQPEQAQEMRLLIAQKWKEMRQEEEFGTVVVDATDGTVMIRHEGLPLHIVGLEDAQEIARSHFEEAEVRLSGFLSVPGYGVWFEFSHAEKKILVDPESHRIATLEDLLKR